MSQSLQRKAWTVVIAGTCINLALGVLYTWSIFKASIVGSIKSGGAFQWDLSSVNDPYAVCCLVFAFSMILAGKVQDRFGPGLTALIGGLLVGAGFVLVSQSASYAIWVLGFGVLAGMGFGFGYSSATPPALKWFPPAKTGLIAGIVVGGFGMASVYIAPLATYLLGAYGLQTAMMIFGIAFAIVVSLLSLLLSNPPAGHLFAAAAAKSQKTLQAAPSVKVEGNYQPSQMLKTVSFYMLWVVYFIGAGAGLMVIGSVAGMAKKSMGEYAFFAVVLLAVGNTAGRIIAGVLSDHIGRALTLCIMLAFQAILMFTAIPVIGAENTSAVLLVTLATFIGFNYGTNLALFPALTKDFWGLKNFGMNYGVLFTAWGVGGFVMGRVSETLVAQSGNFNLSFAVAGVMLTIAAGITLTLKEMKDYQADKAADEAQAQQAIAAPVVAIDQASA